MGDKTRAKFCFVSEAQSIKTTIVKVKTIQLEGEETTYEFPDQFSTREFHKELFESTIVKNIAKSLTSRGKFRKVMITLSEELKALYLDEEGNVCYGELYLSECTEFGNPKTVPNQNIETASHVNIAKRAKDMVLEKFNGRNQNACMFMDLFESECNRLLIDQTKFPELLKVFLCDSAVDWFQSFLKINKIDKPWEFWKNSFLDTFETIGWSEIKYAYEFHYINGHLLEYALKKRNLLLDTDAKISENTQINLIVLGLPEKVQAQLKRKDIVNIDNLMSNLRQIEKPFESGNKIKANLKQEEKIEKKACSFCAQKGFPNRFHPENVCRLKSSETEKKKNSKIKIINNTNLENSIAFSEESKNE